MFAASAFTDTWQVPFDAPAADLVAHLADLDDSLQVHEDLHERYPDGLIPESSLITLDEL